MPLRTPLPAATPAEQPSPAVPQDSDEEDSDDEDGDDEDSDDEDSDDEDESEEAEAERERSPEPSRGKQPASDKGLGRPESPSEPLVLPKRSLFAPVLFALLVLGLLVGALLTKIECGGSKAAGQGATSTSPGPSAPSSPSSAAPSGSTMRDLPLPAEANLSEGQGLLDVVTGVQEATVAVDGVSVGAGVRVEHR